VRVIKIFLGSLGCARSAQQGIGNSVSQRKECVSEIRFKFKGEHSRWAHQDSLRLRRSLKVIEHLGGKFCVGERTTRVVEYSERLFQEGIEHVQVCISELCFEFREKRSVKDKTP
jgi:hypothetical protein